MTAGTVSVSVNAGPIHATGNHSADGTHQLRMGYDLFIHIDSTTAQQWADVLNTITAEEK